MLLLGGLLGLLLLALGLTSGLLGPGEPPPEPETVNLDRAAAPSTAPALEGRAPSRGDAPGGAARARASDPPAAGGPEAAEPAAPRRFAGAAAVVQVLLLLPEAWASLPCEVYALPAGESGANALEGPRTRVPPGATEVPLPLPREGSWDVGCVCHGLGHVLAPGVEVRGPAEVRLDARGAKPIRFRLPRVGTLPGGGAVQVHLEKEGCDYPGRGEAAPVNVRVVLDGGGPLETPPLPPGTRFRLRAWTPARDREGAEWALAPERAEAGAEVDLVVRPLGLVKNRVRLGAPLPASWQETWRTDAHVQIAARRDGEAEPSQFAHTWLRKDGTLKDEVLPLWLPPGRYELTTPRWGGWTPSPGPPRRVDVRAGEALDLDWVLEPDASLRTPGAAPDVPTVVQAVLLPDHAPKGGASVVAAEVEREDGLQWDILPYYLERALEVSCDVPVRRALLWLPPDRASDAFRIPASGEVRVTTRPAGTLVLVPEVLPDPALGVLRVRRTDGLTLPLPTDVDPKNPAGGFEVERGEVAPVVRVGLRLGPIAEGRLDLEVLLGGVVVGRVTAEVRAGRNTPLAIPLPDGALR